MKAKDKEYTYFQPGEIFFLISHKRDELINSVIGNPGSAETNNSQTPDYKGDGQTYNEKMDQLIGWSNTVAQNLGLNLVISRSVDRELHFSGTLNKDDLPKQEVGEAQTRSGKQPKAERRGAFSIIPVEVKLPKQEDDAQKNPDVYLKTPELTKLIVELDNRRQDQPLASEFTLDGVSLNWLSSPCSEWGGGGGPGGIPEPYQGDPQAAPYTFDLPPSKASLQARIGKEGKGVVIAILDTAPCLQDLAAAYERYHKVNPEKRSKHHLLIEDLLKPGGPLTVHPASMDDLLRMRAVHLRDHDYEMADHGLFVAGIIHSLAPQAEIHLFEVLNTQGVGDIVSIAKGLWDVLNSFSGRPLVVNCSLVINVPLLNQPIADLDEAFMAKIVKDWESHKKDQIKWLTSDLLSEEGERWLASQGFAIQWICDHILYQKSRVIAAAGNDWKCSEKKERPQARYPAAYNSVLGVGALPKNAQPDSNGKYAVSSYSNVSDKPKEVGVTTLGGEPGKNKGILGVYIGEFPDMEYRLLQYPLFLRPIMWLVFGICWGNFVRPRNKTDWAWWCGTSFATPIVSGLVAKVLSDLRQPATTQHAIDTMYKTNGILDSLTPNNEDGIEGVRQV